ncbi:MAG: glycine cleavage system aminomethyltransferase GcvT [Chlorobi bacterium]|nr:glycine cleavage system aminomethyltransferase GcvT [Chlorobiota bacterium]MCI0716310.1 glycine cleavage system aminomethyltransferase GcvT [Chlorobiota bacterium]
MHKSLGAKIVEFAGFEMPVQYEGIIAEHLAVRNSVGVFDVSHMGEFFVKGKDALAFVQKVTTNDASKLVKGKVQYSAACYEDGGIVDDLLVYCFGDYFLLVVNGANVQKDFEWFSKNKTGFDVSLEDKSDDYSLLAVQGKNSITALQKLTGTNLSEMKYYTFTEGRVAGIDAIISRTGYTGEKIGFEIYVSSDKTISEKLWNSVFDAGKEFNIKPIGLGARDTLRLEAGYCLYGNDIDNTTNTIEAGLEWITKPDKGDFNGRSRIVSELENGVKRKLAGFIVDGRLVARHGYEIYANGAQSGHVTSGSFSPCMNKNIGLGYVQKQYSEPGTKIDIKIRNDFVNAEIVKIPFVGKN